MEAQTIAATAQAASDPPISGRGLVIFDLDGTLADTLPGISSTAMTVLRAHGFSDQAIGDLRRIVGPPFPQAFSLVYGVSEEEARSITEDYRAIYEDMGPEAWPLFPGMTDALRRLREAGRTVAIASSKRQHLVERVLSDHGVEDLFDLVCGKQSDTGDTKEAAIARILEAFGVSASGAVMVGDRRFDVEAAAHNGIPCVGVLYGGTCDREELVSAGAVVVVDRVEALVDVLLGVAGRSLGG